MASFWLPLQEYPIIRKVWFVGFNDARARTDQRVTYTRLKMKQDEVNNFDMHEHRGA